MSDVSFAPHDASLLRAALLGDADAYHDALASDGIHVNALDHEGRTVLGCLVSGENWQTHDASFMTPARLGMIRSLVAREDVSLYTLNAPQDAMSGVTPLGMVAWLDSVEACSLLLEGSRGRVMVNATDGHGATALMYAARDGHLNVVAELIKHGARPDFRDSHFRSGIHYAIASLDALKLCEESLRQRRWAEFQAGNHRNLIPLPFDYQPTFAEPAQSCSDPTMTAAMPPVSRMESTTRQLSQDLNLAIARSDLSIVLDLLFPYASPMIHPIPNLFDPSGWSPIHHCNATPTPSIEVLDALYLAGADVNLFTEQEHYTALHCLALFAEKGTFPSSPSTREPSPLSSVSSLPSSSSSSSSAVSASPPPSPGLSRALHQYTTHLVRDLNAPLAAVDQNGDTCIHVAARQGWSFDVLCALISCDENGHVRQIRNHAGLTAQQVCKPSFRTAFESRSSAGAIGADIARPPSSASARTIRPNMISPTQMTTTTTTSSTPNKIHHRHHAPVMSSPLLSSTASVTSTKTESDTDTRALAQQLLDHLQHTSPSSHSGPGAAAAYSDPDDSTASTEVMPDVVESFDRSLHDAAQVGSDILAALRARTAAGAEEIRGVRALLGVVECRLEGAESALKEKLANNVDVDREAHDTAASPPAEDVGEDDEKHAYASSFSGRPRGATVGSEDSQTTAVSSSHQSCYTDGSTLAPSTSSFSATAKAKLSGGPSRVSLTPSRKSRTRFKGTVTTAGGRLASWLEAMFLADSSQNVPPVPTLPADILEGGGDDDDNDDYDNSGIDAYGFPRVRNSRSSGKKPLRKSASSSSMVNVPPPPAKENRIKMWLRKRRASEVSRAIVGGGNASVHSRPSYTSMTTVSEPTSPARNSPEPVVPTTAESLVVLSSSAAPVSRQPFEAQRTLSLYGSRDVLDCARRDVADLHRCIELMDSNLAEAKSYLTRAERILRNALSARESIYDQLCLSVFPDPLGDFISTSPSLTSSFSTSAEVPLSAFNDDPIEAHTSTFMSWLSPTAHSSQSSLSSTVAAAAAPPLTPSEDIRRSTDANNNNKNEIDSDVRALRRLLLRKIEGRLSYVTGQAQKADDWLRILKESARCVAERTLLST